TVTTGPTRVEIFTAAQHFERATRSRIRSEHAQAAALRTSAKRLLRTAGQPADTALIADLLITLTLVAIAAHRFHQARGHAQQAAAAQTTLTHLQTAYQHTAAPVLAQLATHAPRADIQHGYADLIRHVLPEHAERILADPSWPALTATLTSTEAAGTPVKDTLAEAAGQRELHTATHPAEVLLWRLHHTPSKHADAIAARSPRGPVAPPAASPTQAPKRHR
ncbi:relaxase/mobilization nuclease domain-containing protein, partial [Streptomyces aculeolatus]